MTVLTVPPTAARIAARADPAEPLDRYKLGMLFVIRRRKRRDASAALSIVSTEP
jgi:hypothetical protein